MTNIKTGALRMEAMEVTPASLKQLRAYMQYDFPALERIPFACLKRAFRKNYLRAAWFADAGGRVGYVVYHLINGLGVAHIMYFAILPSRRGGGMGSTALRLFRQEMDGLGILLEVEDPECAHGVDERLGRDRRVAFYERNGFALAPDARLDFFSVPMAVMSDCGLEVEDWEKLYQAVYHRMLGAWPPTLFIRRRQRPGPRPAAAHAGR